MLQASSWLSYAHLQALAVSAVGVKRQALALILTDERLNRLLELLANRRLQCQIEDVLDLAIDGDAIGLAMGYP
jgi:hypothetical protein